MREDTYVFSEGLTKGLRRFKTNPINNESLIELHNLSPEKLGIEAHEALTNLNASGISWGGIGSKAAITDTRDITISISDYVTEGDVAGASVYIDDVLQGTTDANGEIDITGITVGGHTIKVTAAGYVDSDDDDLLNDYFVVT